MYFHADDVILFEDCELFVIIVFFLDHLGHFLQFFLVPLGHVGSNAYIVKLIPKRLSSISTFLATYLDFSDLFCAESTVFYIPTVVHSFPR
jgi:hypothetical protein